MYEREAGDMMSEWILFKTSIMSNSCVDLWPETGHCLLWRQPKNLVVVECCSCHAQERDQPNQSRLSTDVLAGRRHAAVVLAEVKADF